MVNYNIVEQINCALENGASTLNQIKKQSRLEVNLSTIFYYIKKEELKFIIKKNKDNKKTKDVLSLKLKTYKQIKKIQKYKNRDRLINIGLSSHKLSQIFEISREGVINYIHRRNLYDKWKISRIFYRNAEKQKKQQIQEQQNNRKHNCNNLVNVLTSYIDSKLTNEERKIHDITRKFFSNKKNKKGYLRKPYKKLSFEKVYQVFEYYFKQKNNNCEIIYSEIAKILNVTPSIIVNWYKGVDVFESKFHNYSYLEKEILNQSENTVFSNADLSILLNRNSPESIVNYLRKIEIKKTLKQTETDFIKKMKKEGLTYSNCMQISLAGDLSDGEYKFSKDEIKDMLNLSNKQFLFYEKNKNLIEKQIINSLQKLYKDKNIKKPYL